MFVPFTLPQLIVPSTKEEIQSWAEKILHHCSFSFNGGVNPSDANEFDAAEGVINESQFRTALDLYTGQLNGGQYVMTPAPFRRINIIAPMLDRIMGQVLSQPLNFTTSVNDTATQDLKYDEHLAVAADRLKRLARQEMGMEQMIGQHLYEDDAVPESPEEVKSLKFEKYKNEWEEVFQPIVDGVLKDHDISFKYKTVQQMLYNELCSNKMFAEVYYDGEKPNIRYYDSRFSGYVLSPDSPYIQDGVLFYTIQYYTLEEIITNFSDLDEGQIEELKSIQFAYYYNRQAQVFANNYIYRDNRQYWDDCFVWDAAKRILKIKVCRCYWKANKPIRVIEKDGDFEGGKIHTIVDDKKKVKDGAKERYKYKEVVYGGVLFGTIFGGSVTEVQGEMQNPDQPHKKKLPVYGFVSMRPSLVRNIMPLQELRIQLFRDLERLSLQTNGNIMMVDKAAGGDPMRNVYNMYMYRMYEYNSAEEGMPNAANNLKTQDMDNSKAIYAIINVLNYIDQNIYLVSGLNEAAVGNLKDYTAASVASQQLGQSQLSNLWRLENFYTVCTQMLTAMCNLIPNHWEKNSDQAMSWLSVKHQRMLNRLLEEKDGFPYMAVQTDYSPSDAVTKQTMLQLANNVLPTTNDPNFVLTIFKMIMQGTSKEAMAVFEVAVERMKAEKQQEQEAAQQQQMQIAQMQMQAKQAPAQIQAQAHVQGKQIGAQAELQKQAMKNQHEGQMSDVGKQNEMDMMVADKAMNASPIEQAPPIG